MADNSRLGTQNAAEDDGSEIPNVALPTRFKLPFETWSKADILKSVLLVAALAGFLVWSPNIAPDLKLQHFPKVWKRPNATTAFDSWTRCLVSEFDAASHVLAILGDIDDLCEVDQINREEIEILESTDFGRTAYKDREIPFNGTLYEKVLGPRRKIGEILGLYCTQDLFQPRIGQLSYPIRRAGHNFAQFVALQESRVKKQLDEGYLSFWPQGNKSMDTACSFWSETAGESWEAAAPGKKLHYMLTAILNLALEHEIATDDFFKAESYQRTGVRARIFSYLGRPIERVSLSGVLDRNGRMAMVRLTHLEQKKLERLDELVISLRILIDKWQSITFHTIHQVWLRQCPPSTQSRIDRAFLEHYFRHWGHLVGPSVLRNETWKAPLELPFDFVKLLDYLAFGDLTSTTDTWWNASKTSGSI